MSAATILRELGPTFQATSARDFHYPQNGISFRLIGTRGIDRVMIVEAARGFTMTFYQGQAEIVSATVEQCQLRATFARHTGLS